MKTILITGGTGLIGSALTDKLLSRGYAVRHLSRTPRPNGQVPSFKWSIKDGFIDPESFENVSVIVHLAGAPIAPKRWTEERIEVLNQSRAGATELLHRYCQQTNCSIETFISAAGAHFHGAISGDRIFTEDDPPGDDIIARISVNWEKAAELFNDVSRVVKLRTPLVLSASGGALPKMATPARFGLGSAIGNGEQWMPWIHLEDIVKAYVLSIENPSMQGTYHTAAPEHIRNRDFMKTMADALSKPFWLPPVPGFIIKGILGRQASILLQGSRVSSARIQQAGMEWKYPSLESALIEELA